VIEELYDVQHRMRKKKKFFRHRELYIVRIVPQDTEWSRTYSNPGLVGAMSELL
jgi:hypothetical protein